MVTECRFNDETFKKRNGCALYINDDTQYDGCIRMMIITGNIETEKLDLIVPIEDLRRAIDRLRCK